MGSPCSRNIDEFWYRFNLERIEIWFYYFYLWRSVYLYIFIYIYLFMNIDLFISFYFIAFSLYNKYFNGKIACRLFSEATDPF